MKTNVTLSSPDRNLFGLTIKQETSTGFLSLSDLQEAYTKARVIHCWSHKEVQQIIQQKENMERVYYILFERNIINLDFSRFMEECGKIGFLKFLKKIGVYKTTGARQTKSTYCDPYIWILIAMELSPMLYAKVTMWLTDKLILNRIEAGHFYKALSKALGKFKENREQIDYVKLAKALNNKIFGRHETGIRNFATKDQLQKLYELESNLAFAIDMGYITKFDDVIHAINR